jgi:superfamily II DNA or RNA helicase
MMDFFEEADAAPALKTPPPRFSRPVPRHYQEEARAAIMETWDAYQSTLLVLPTGTGKTVTFCDVASRVAGRVMILAHREELIFQAQAKAESFGMECDVEMGEFKSAEWRKPKCVAASVQTMTAGKPPRMEKFDPFDFDLLVVDEGHHGIARSYRRIVQYFQRNPQLRVLYVTATPKRTDKKAMGIIAESVAYEYKLTQAIQDGWLVPIEQEIAFLGALDYSEAKTVNGDFTAEQIASIMSAEGVIPGIARVVWETLGNRKAISFSASVAEAQSLSENFNRYGPGMSEWICGDTPKEVRRKCLADFAAGKFQILANCGALVEGFDECTIEVIIQARPTKSVSMYTQIIGRGTRPLTGLVDGLATAEERRAAIAASAKPCVTVIDFTGIAGKHKLVSTADILGGDYSEKVRDEAVKRAKKAKKPVRMGEMLEKVHKEREARKARELAKKAGLKAKVNYTIQKIDPFDVFDIVPCNAQGASPNPLTPEQLQRLERNGIKGEDMPPAQARQLLNEIYQRQSAGLCTIKQAKILKRFGYDGMNLTYEQAGKAFTELKANNWKRPAR